MQLNTFSNRVTGMGLTQTRQVNQFLYQRAIERQQEYHSKSNAALGPLRAGRCKVMILKI
jgi:hypothetical protein